MYDLLFRGRVDDGLQECWEIKLRPEEGRGWCVVQHSSGFYWLDSFSFLVFDMLIQEEEN